MLFVLFCTLQAQEGNKCFKEIDYYITEPMFLKSLGFKCLHAMNFLFNKGSFLSLTPLRTSVKDAPKFIWFNCAPW